MAAASLSRWALAWTAAASACWCACSTWITATALTSPRSSWRRLTWSVCSAMSSAWRVARSASASACTACNASATFWNALMTVAR